MQTFKTADELLSLHSLSSPANGPSILLGDHTGTPDPNLPNKFIRTGKIEAPMPTTQNGSHDNISSPQEQSTGHAISKNDSLSDDGYQVPTELVVTDERQITEPPVIMVVSSDPPADGFQEVKPSELTPDDIVIA